MIHHVEKTMTYLEPHTTVEGGGGGGNWKRKRNSKSIILSRNVCIVSCWCSLVSLLSPRFTLFISLEEMQTTGRQKRDVKNKVLKNLYRNAHLYVYHTKSDTVVSSFLGGGEGGGMRRGIGVT